MRLKDAMAITKILVKDSVGIDLSEWADGGLMFDPKSMAVAFRVISGKAKFPNLIHAMNKLKDKVTASSYYIVGFPRGGDIEPVICMNLTTFLKFMAKPQDSLRLRSDIIMLEDETGVKLGRI